jgi:hypothetical protein
MEGDPAYRIACRYQAPPSRQDFGGENDETLVAIQPRAWWIKSLPLRFIQLKVRKVHPGLFCKKIKSLELPRRRALLSARLQECLVCLLKFNRRRAVGHTLVFGSDL